MGIHDLEPVVLNEAPNEIPHQYLSAEKARRELGWKSTYTLQEGLLETIGWVPRLLTGGRRKRMREAGGESNDD